MRRHKLPTRGGQIAPSASELPLWESENPRVFLIEGPVSIHSQDLLLTDPRNGDGGEGASAMNRVKGYCSLPQVASEQEIESNVAGTCYYPSPAPLPSDVCPALTGQV